MQHFVNEQIAEAGGESMLLNINTNTNMDRPLSSTPNPTGITQRILRECLQHSEKHNQSILEAFLKNTLSRIEAYFKQS